MMQALDHQSLSTTRGAPSAGSPERGGTQRRPAAKGLSDRQAVIAAMVANGVSCQVVAFDLLLPLRTVQGHLHQALRILNLERVEDLTYEVIAVHYTKNLAAATPRPDQRDISQPTSAPTSAPASEPASEPAFIERPNALVALDAAEASLASDEDQTEVAGLRRELEAARRESGQNHEALQQLHQAIHSRDTIGQAKGILMERYKVSADAAFRILQDKSNHSNRKLVDVAHDLIY